MIASVAGLVAASCAREQAYSLALGRSAITGTVSAVGAAKEGSIARIVARTTFEEQCSQMTGGQSISGGLKGGLRMPIYLVTVY
jgi:hypothetical protein